MWRTSAALLACCHFACGALSPLEVQKEIGSSLVQVVRVSDTEPARGDTIDIVSTVRNLGPYVIVDALDCVTISGVQLTFLLDPAFGCEGGGRAIAAGDSLVSGGPFAVVSPVGTYTARLQHLVDPEVIVEFEIRVKE